MTSQPDLFGHEDECDKNVYEEGGHCTCDVIREYGREPAQHGNPDDE